MKLKILWPGKTRNGQINSLQEFYLKKINQLETCQVLETKEAKGIEEKFAEKIKNLEAAGLEKHIKDDYIICLSDQGKEMSSVEFARFLEKLASSSSKMITFVVGGFLGLEERILKRAHFLLSLSPQVLVNQIQKSKLSTLIRYRHNSRYYLGISCAPA